MVARRLTPRLAAAVAVAASLAMAAPAHATLLVRSNSSGLFVQDKNGLSDTVSIAQTTLNGQPAYLVTNLNAGDVFAFDRQAGCREGENGRQVICDRLGDRFRIELRAGNDTLNLGDAPRGRSVVVGGSGDDRITGHSGNDDLTGGSGRDNISGGGFEDKIVGGSGRDTLDGGSADDDVRGGSSGDTVRGGSEDDRVDGGTGNDQVIGNSGVDRLFGGSGDDVLTSKESSGEAQATDTSVHCGLGFDGVVADLGDNGIDLASDPGGGTCEEIDRSPVGETPHVRVLSSTLDVDGRGRAAVRLLCPRPTTVGCNGRLSLRLARGGSPRPARTSYRIAAGRSRTVIVRMTAAELRRLRPGARGFLESVERGRIGPKTTIRSPRLR